jgi:ribosome-associated protein
MSVEIMPAQGEARVDVNERIRIADEELEWSYARSGGPGGQNVNKVNSKAILRWHLGATSCLPDEVKVRLQGQQRRRITAEGDLVLSSQRYRDQERNRADCLEKLRAMVLQACEAPRPRKATRPTRGSRQRRLDQKRHRSQALGRRAVGEE